MLPQRAQKLISDYSKPLTHPNWKNRRWIPIEYLYNEINYNMMNRKMYYKLYGLFLLNVQNNNRWATLFSSYESFGLKKTSINFDIPIHVLSVILSVQN